MSGAQNTRRAKAEAVAALGAGHRPACVASPVVWREYVAAAAYDQFGAGEGRYTGGYGPATPAGGYDPDWNYCADCSAAAAAKHAAAGRCQPRHNAQRVATGAAEVMEARRAREVAHG